MVVKVGRWHGGVHGARTHEWVAFAEPAIELGDAFDICRESSQSAIDRKDGAKSRAIDCMSTSLTHLMVQMAFDLTSVGRE